METKGFKIFMINSGHKFNLYCSNKNLKLYFNNLLFTTFLSIMNLFSFFLAMITSLEARSIVAGILSRCQLYPTHTRSILSCHKRLIGCLKGMCVKSTDYIKLTGTLL